MMYIFKSILITTIIYLFYKLFLQRETFFQSIRWYFIIGIVVSLLLPLLIVPIYVTVNQVTATEFVEVSAIKELVDYTGIDTRHEITKPIDWLLWLKSIYLIGVAFFILKFSLELFSLVRLISISKKNKKNNYFLVETNAEVSPFSFFNYIVYNKKKFKNSELKSIIEHEKVHVDQKHSIDILLVQLFVILHWFNPFVWLYKKDLQQNLEYIADNIAQNKAETYKKYQYLLLKTSIKNNPFALSNNFFNSQLKKRIMMLQRSQTKKLNQLKYVLLLPLIAIFIYSFNTKEVYIQKDSEYSNYKNKTVIIDVSHGGNDSGISINGYDEKELVLAISKKIADTYQGNASLIFTRSSDEFVSLEDRITQINTAKPDLVISLHINNAKDVRENGVIAYISNQNHTFKQSKEVASLLLNNLTGTNLKNNGVSKSNLKLNSAVNCPSVTLELGYLSNKMDRAYLTSYKGQQEIAQSLVDFINGKQKATNTTHFILPIHKDNIISISGYGMRIHPITKKKKFHKGVDFRAYNKMDVYAVASGNIINAGFDNDKGYFIEIEHKNGFITNYQHLGNLQIEKGDVVTPGEIIGFVGNTGKSVAPHLHFEILKDGKNVNPKDYLESFVKRENKKYQNITTSNKIEYLKIVITNTTTKETIKMFNKSFKDKVSKIRIHNVVRNENDEIISFNIQTRFESQNRFFTNIRIKPSKGVIQDFNIEKLDKKEAFKVTSDYDSKEKHYSIIDKDGVKLFFDEKINLKNLMNNVSKDNKKDIKGVLIDSTAIKAKIKSGIKQSGWVLYKEKTYFYMLDNKEVDFFNKYGDKIENKMANKLLTYFNNKYKTNYTLNTKSNNFIHYQGKTYYYSIKDNNIIFLNRYGERIDTLLSLELIKILNNEKKVNYQLNRM